MAELFRIMAMLLALFSQLLGGGSFNPFPTPTAPPAPTATVPPTAPPAPTSTATPLPPTATPTRTLTPTRTATATRTATPTAISLINEDDPTGFSVVGVPPAQKLPTAVLIYPLVSTAGSEDTLVEMMNLTNGSVSVKCHYVDAATCRGIDFFVNLTPQQPIAWMASTGQDGNGKRIAPPLNSDHAELKCFVQPSSTSLSAHNALQGRAIVADGSGQTIGYTAIGFRRLIAGSFTGSVQLDGVTYESCPDRLHFNALAQQSGSDSELVLIPCEQNLLLARATKTTVQFAVINEFEQHFSGSLQLECMARRRFSTIPSLRRTTVGTDTVHAIVRAVSVPVVGMVIDRFTVPGSGAASTSSNMPYLEGGRSSTVTIPTFPD